MDIVYTVNILQLFLLYTCPFLYLGRRMAPMTYIYACSPAYGASIEELQLGRRIFCPAKIIRYTVKKCAHVWLRSRLGHWFGLLHDVALLRENFSWFLGLQTISDTMKYKMYIYTVPTWSEVLYHFLPSHNRSKIDGCIENVYIVLNVMWNLIQYTKHSNPWT
jgi:hypothetical protein